MRTYLRSGVLGLALSLVVAAGLAALLWRLRFPDECAMTATGFSLGRTCPEPAFGPVWLVVTGICVPVGLVFTLAATYERERRAASWEPRLCADSRPSA